MIKKIMVVFACIAVSTVLGSIHAFSVLLPGWESELLQVRTAVSLVYSLALVFLTLAVLFGHHLYRRLSAPVIFLLVAIGSGAGLLLSSISQSIIALYIFYGCLFGAANGLGYGYALQLAGQVTERHHAWSMSLVTAFYAVGAAVSSRTFHDLLVSGGNAWVLQVAGYTVIAVCLIAVLITAISGVKFHTEPIAAIGEMSARMRRLRWVLGLAYGAAVSAGLMVIGHAYPIVLAKFNESTSAALAPMVVAIGNVIGGLSVGLLASVLRQRTLLIVFSLLSLLGLFMLLQQILLLESFIFLGLLLLGYSYGAIIAIFPVVVADVFGKLASARVYGQIFIAWGIAGLVAPTLSGYLFDLFGDYRWSLVMAIVLCLLAIAIFSLTSPHRSPERVSSATAIDSSGDFPKERNTGCISD